MSVGDSLSQGEQKILLEEARRSLECGVNGMPLEPLNLADFSPKLQKNGVVFVTLTIQGKLRGCVGAIEAYQPLIEDVREHAIAAGLRDYRFPPVKSDELDEISMEISRLTIPQPLHYESPEDLLRKLRPGIDGVVIKEGGQRATFLPQVWEKLPSPIVFLEHLCQKMGTSPDLWRQKNLDIYTYQVEELHE